MRRDVLVFFILPLILFSCKNDTKIPEEIEDISIDLKVERFDKQFAQASIDSLPHLMQAYPYLFPKQYPIDFWEQRLNDTLQEEIDREVLKRFPDFYEQESRLKHLYKHIKFYYPKTPVPKVITVTSEVDYKNAVINTDTLLIIALDNYLGNDHKFYTGIQNYFSENFRPEQIEVDVAESFVDKILPNKPRRKFLDEMIYHGKRLYLIEQLLPLKEKYELIGYKKDKYSWAQDNEVNIWTYFVDQELLFKTDRKLLQRFINPAPFSKFYMQFDNESPPRLGRYMGWQIVKAYMENTNVPLQMLPKKAADEIFKKANYKPKK